VFTHVELHEGQLSFSFQVRLVAPGHVLEVPHSLAVLGDMYLYFASTMHLCSHRLRTRE
jgi:hypothetical protein